MPGNEIDVVFSFDMTGSMRQAIGEVRRNVKEMVERLFHDIPGIRMGIVAHGDYCDEDTSYLMVKQDLTDNVDDLVRFVNETGVTDGGDAPEAYEYVLHEIQKMAWEGKAKVLVMIADSYPHTKQEDKYGYDWHAEVAEMKRMGIAIYSMQCLDRGNTTAYSFYKTMAQETGGYHLFLSQFTHIHEILTAICMQVQGEDELVKYEQEVTKNRGGMMPIALRAAFDIMLRRESAPAPMTETEYAAHFRRSWATDDTDAEDLRPCPPAKFQIIEVERDSPIADFVRSHGLMFHEGDGFYEWMKPETIQAYKKVVLMERSTGNLFEGARARVMAGIPLGTEVKKYRPTILSDYIAFVQSTSPNRKLIGGTKFLYKVSEES